jgi:hypothetical protein
MDRLRLSERRLLRVLAALVEKRFARPLDRDNRGTLWRVYLPREAAGEPLGDDVLVGRAGAPRTVPAAPVGAAAVHPERSAAEAAARGGRGARPRSVATELSLARALAAARGRGDPEALAGAVREVRELLAEGQHPDRIAACIETIRRRAARAAQPGEAA